MKQELDLVFYQAQVQLMESWDYVFTVLDDHLSGPVPLKSLPHSNTMQDFKEEGGSWEDHLTELRGAFGVWVEVQRRQAYLEGNFTAVLR